MPIHVFVRHAFLRDLSIRDADDRHQWDLFPIHLRQLGRQDFRYG